MTEEVWDGHPPEPFRLRQGFHWLQYKDGDICPFFYFPMSGEDGKENYYTHYTGLTVSWWHWKGDWHYEYYDQAIDLHEMHSNGFRYIGPCTPPRTMHQVLALRALMAEDRS